jgi:DmsE family decaheme c-type cytochrome
METRTMTTRGIFGRWMRASWVAGCLVLPSGSSAQERLGAACVDCHPDQVSGFPANIHSKTAFYGRPGSCESCHPGALEHAQSGDPDAVSQQASQTCLKCHDQDRPLTLWRGSAHQRELVGCTSCHAVHANRPRLLTLPEENLLCYSCHLNIRSELMRRSKHPLRDSSSPSAQGKLSCSACHNPHGAPSRGLIEARTVNDKCYQCHFEKRAPVLWEHSPVKQDCLICHAAHGSSNDKLLTTKVPRLCQECHMQGRHQSGTLAPNSVFAFNRSCLNCHPQVHGSNSPSGAVLQR